MDAPFQQIAHTEFAADLFALQDDITSQIAVALKFELIAGEAARPTGHPDALDFIFRGRATLAKPPTRDSYAEAIRLFERALALDPGFVGAQTRLAEALSSRALDGMADRAADDVTRAEELIGQALAASPRSAFAHHVKGNLLRWRGRCEAAIPEYETALAFNHNAVGTRLGLARCKLLTGSIGGDRLSWGGFPTFAAKLSDDEVAPILLKNSEFRQV